MKVVIIVQARMTSTRLPGKVLMKVLDKTLLEYQIERLQRVKLADEIVIATTTNATDQPIVELCEQLKVSCYRGSENDVLARYDEAARACGAEVVVRLTSDCPLIDPLLIDHAIGAYLDAAGRYDYVSNMIEPSWPCGMAVEVFSAQALAEAHAEASEAAEREHVTPFIYWRSGRYRLKSLTMQPDLSHHRWTVDTPEDFELVRRILEALYPHNPHFVMADVLALLAEHADWAAINCHVAQKTISPATTKN